MPGQCFLYTGSPLVSKIDSVFFQHLSATLCPNPEFWTDNARVWFVQTQAQFAVRGVTSSLTKIYYCVEALNHADAAQVVDLIEFPPEENPYESLKEQLRELHTLNPFKRSPWWWMTSCAACFL